MSESERWTNCSACLQSQTRWPATALLLPGEALGAAQPKVSFVLGGPGGKTGPSAQVARGLRALGEIEAGFIDLEQLQLSDSPEDADAGFRFCLSAMRFASVVVWVFGTAARFMPVRMRRLVDKLFAADARCERGGAAAVVTSTSVRDDWQGPEGRPRHR